jgi:threonine dehydrogenase-like Zn-dependent dehydrogenase
MTPVAAAVSTAALTTEVQRLPVPDIGPDDALLDVEAVGVCATDWKFYRREVDVGPLILGHENVGRIRAIGERAAEAWGVRVGDRVAVEEFIPCGRCRLCRSGHYRICEATDYWSTEPYLRYGATPITVPPALWGGFSEVQYLHPNSIVYPVSPSVAPELAALFIPVANGLRWVLDDGEGSVGDAILIQGPGQHGLGCVVAAREGGLHPIIVAGLAQDRERLELARTLGADHTVEADHEDLVATVSEITGGAMADVVVDISPDPGAVERALAAAAKRATVVMAGYKGGRPIAGFQNDTVIRKELTIRGVRGHDHRSVEPAIRLIEAGAHPLDALCTHRYGLGDVDRALRVVGERADPSAVHVTVSP